jgi:hypothetical protein
VLDHYEELIGSPNSVINFELVGLNWNSWKASLAFFNTLVPKTAQRDLDIWGLRVIWEESIYMIEHLQFEPFHDIGIKGKLTNRRQVLKANESRREVYRSSMWEIGQRWQRFPNIQMKSMQFIDEIIKSINEAIPVSYIVYPDNVVSVTMQCSEECWKRLIVKANMQFALKWSFQ